MVARQTAASGQDESIFDSHGTARAYLTTGPSRRICLWDGRQVGQLRGDDVYGVNGQHLGWYVRGVVYDHRGFRVGFRRDVCPAVQLSEPSKTVMTAAVMERSTVLQPSPARPPLEQSISDESLEGLLLRGLA